MSVSLSRVFTSVILFLFSTMLIVLPAPADEVMGGITFVGEREGVCVLIEGEYMEEALYFKLDTCDENKAVKSTFKDRTPFTLLVPKGDHRLVIMKEGERVITDRIMITPGEILDYQLP